MTTDPTTAVWRWDDVLVAWERLDGPVDADRLVSAERALVDGAPSEHRARELFAGRLAAQRVLRTADPGFSTRAVLPDAQGRPRLEPPGDDAISLAHDGSYAVAAYAHDAVGIDVVDLARAERVRGVVELRLAKGLARTLDLAGHHAEELPAPVPCLLWATWEAAGKRRGGGVLSGPMLLSWAVTRDAEGRWAVTNDDSRVRFKIADGHLLAVATAAP